MVKGGYNIDHHPDPSQGPLPQRAVSKSAAVLGTELGPHLLHSPSDWPHLQAVPPGEQQYPAAWSDC